MIVLLFGISCCSGCLGCVKTEIVVVPPDVVLAIRDAVDRSCVDDIWDIWSWSAEACLVDAYCNAGGPTAAGSSAVLAEVYHVFVGDVLEAELLVAGDLVGCIGPVKGMRLFIVLSTL